MKVQDKINERLKELRALDYEKMVETVMEYYGFSNLADFSITIKKEKEYFVLIDDYNEVKYKDKSLKQCYIFMFEDILEQIYAKELQLEREEEERAERKHRDKIYWDKQIKVTA